MHSHLPSPFQPPTLRADLPTYPQVSQLLRVTAATVPGPAGVAQFAGSSFLGPTLYVGFVQQIRNDSLLPRDREPCLVDDVNGLGLTPGFYTGVLKNSFNSLPVFTVTDSVNADSKTLCAQIQSVFTGYVPGQWNFITVDPYGFCRFMQPSMCNSGSGSGAGGNMSSDMPSSLCGTASNGDSVTLTFTSNATWQGTSVDNVFLSMQCETQVGGGPPYFWNFNGVTQQTFTCSSFHATFVLSGVTWTIMPCP